MASPTLNLNDAIKVAMERLQGDPQPIETTTNISSVTITNFPSGQTVSFPNTSTLWLNNRSVGMTINNFPDIQKTYVISGITVTNFPIIQNVSFISGVTVNNFPDVQKTSIISGITVTNFPASMTVALAFNSNVWLNNRSAGITVNNFPSIQNVAISSPVIFIKQPLNYTIYDGIAAATTSLAVNVSIAKIHSFYFQWNGSRNGIKVFIEHNSIPNSLYPWIDLFNSNSPNGNDLQTVFKSVEENIMYIRARITGNYSGGNLKIFSVHN